MLNYIIGLPHKEYLDGTTFSITRQLGNSLTHQKLKLPGLTATQLTKKTNAKINIQDLDIQDFVTKQNRPVCG